MNDFYLAKMKQMKLPGYGTGIIYIEKNKS